MPLSGSDITITVTIYNRRQFLKQAIASALDQTVPVRVIVVENCSPDAGMEAFVRGEFGSRIEYFRNPRTVGIFRNFNNCMKRCPTPWLSILHDDDYLAPGFVAAMIELSRHAPDCGLYFGETTILDEVRGPIAYGRRPITAPWQRVTLQDTITITPFSFPGQLFRPDQALAVGGFCEHSQYCGDWELWCKLIAYHGAAQTRDTVAFNRSHSSGRESSKVHISGRVRPLSFVQQKRIFHLLRETGTPARFDRARLLRDSPMSVDYLVRHGGNLTPRLLRYHIGLLLRSSSPSFPHVVFKSLTRCFGVNFVTFAGRLANSKRVRT